MIKKSLSFKFAEFAGLWGTAFLISSLILATIFSIQNAFAADSINNGKMLGTLNSQDIKTFDNRIINGDFLVTQYNGTSTVTPTTGAYFNDMWYWSLSQASKLTEATTTSTAPNGFQNSQLITSSSAYTVGAAERFWLGQKIEGINTNDFQFGTSGAHNIMVSFQAKASTAGTYCFALWNSGRGESYVNTYAATTSWQTFTFSVPGDTNGTWQTGQNATGMEIAFDLGTGANFQTNTLGAWQTSTGMLSNSGCTGLVSINAATLNIANVRAYPGVSIVPYVPRPFATELLLAQRYFQKSFPIGTTPAQNSGLAGALCIQNPIALGEPSGFVRLSPRMMAAPSTITTYNPSASNANWRDVTAASDITASTDPASAKGETGFEIGTTGTVTTLADHLCIQWKAQSTL